MVWSLLGAPGEKKRENQMDLQSSLSGKKKCAHFLYEVRIMQSFKDLKMKGNKHRKSLSYEDGESA